MKYTAGSRPSEPAPEIPSGPFDVQELLDKCREILRREIINLMMESGRGKLREESASELVRYIKLLEELKASEQDTIKNLTTEQLQAIVKK